MTLTNHGIRTLHLQFWNTEPQTPFCVHFTQGTLKFIIILYTVGPNAKIIKVLDIYFETGTVPFFDSYYFPFFLSYIIDFFYVKARSLRTFSLDRVLLNQRPLLLRRRWKYSFTNCLPHSLKDEVKHATNEGK